MTFNELEDSGALRALKALVASDVPFDEELNAMFLYAKKKGRNRASLCVMYEVTTADSVRVSLLADLISRFLWIKDVDKIWAESSVIFMPEQFVAKLLKLLRVDEGQTD